MRLLLACVVVMLVVGCSGGHYTGKRITTDLKDCKAYLEME